MGEILGRTAGIASVRYDSVITAAGMPPMTQKVSLKKAKMRTELTAQGQAMVYLVDMDAKTMYMYIPAQNMAIKMDFSKATEPATKSIEAYKPVVIGTETLGGKVCLVVEYTAEGVKTKSWIWKENGFPIRIEATTTAGEAVVENKNIEFVDIPDSMFQLPAGVQITEMPAMPK